MGHHDAILILVAGVLLAAGIVMMITPGPAFVFIPLGLVVAMGVVRAAAHVPPVFGRGLIALLLVVVLAVLLILLVRRRPGGDGSRRCSTSLT